MKYCKFYSRYNLLIFKGNHWNNTLRIKGNPEKDIEFKYIVMDPKTYKVIWE